MNLAFFLIHRHDLGRVSQARIQGTLVIIAINLVFGFMVPGIDNMAHIGGLVAGFLLGYGLAPKYEVVNQYSTDARVVDTRSLLNRWWIPALGVVILATGIPLSILYWQG